MLKENTIVTFDITGNGNQDVYLCLISGLFNTDSPVVIERYTKRRYEQILSEMDQHPLVKVRGNMPSLSETIWLLRNMDYVYSISITSPTALKELDLNLEFSCWNGRNSMGGTDFLEVNNYVKSSNPAEAYINLSEEPLMISTPHLFMSFNVKAESSFRLSFIGQLKESLSPPLVIQKNNPVPLVCKSCGAPLHDRQCDYCGNTY